MDDKRGSRFKHFWQANESAGNGLKLNYIWHVRQFAYALVPGLFVLAVAETLKYKLRLVEEENHRLADAQGGSLGQVGGMPGDDVAAAVTDNPALSGTNTDTDAGTETGRLAARVDALQRELAAMKAQVQSQSHMTASKQSPILQRNMTNRGIGAGAGAASSTLTGNEQDTASIGACSSNSAPEKLMSFLWESIGLQVREWAHARLIWLKEVVADPICAMRASGLLPGGRGEATVLDPLEAEMPPGSDPGTDTAEVGAAAAAAAAAPVGAVVVVEPSAIDLYPQASSSPTTATTATTATTTAPAPSSTSYGYTAYVHRLVENSYRWFVGDSGTGCESDGDSDAVGRN